MKILLLCLLAVSLQKEVFGLRVETVGPSGSDFDKLDLGWMNEVPGFSQADREHGAVNEDEVGRRPWATQDDRRQNRTVTASTHESQLPPELPLDRSLERQV